MGAGVGAGGVGTTVGVGVAAGCGRVGGVEGCRRRERRIRRFSIRLWAEDKWGELMGVGRMGAGALVVWPWC